MKKSIVVLLLSAAMIFSLYSCSTVQPQEHDSESSAISSEESTEESTEETTEETVLSAEEELQIYRIATEAINDEFGDVDLSSFEASIYKFKSGEFSVSYTFVLCGIRTEEGFSVELTPELEVKRTYSDNIGKYSKYLNDIEFKTAVEAAKEKITKQVEAYGQKIEKNMLYYVEIDGYVCVSTEIIVDLDPPAGQNMGGCGIDHDHIFFTERICPIS